jgi:hypothetical protein
MMNSTLVLLSLLAQASATTSAPDAKARAQVTLKEGTQLYQQGAFADALDKFEQAYSVFPSPKLFFNIGRANRELGRPVDAVDAFEKFLSQALDAPPELLAEAKRSVQELAPKIGKLLIDCAVVDAEITVDGKQAGKAPLTDVVRVSPGRHQVTATSPQMIPAVETVDVAAGTVQTVEIRPRTLAEAAPVANETSTPSPSVDLQAARPMSPTSSDGWWLGRKWTWVAAGTTVAFVGAAAIAGSMMQSKYDDLRNSCGTAAGANWTGCSSSQVSSLDTRKNIANVLWGLSAAATVTTGVLFFVEGHDVTVAPIAGGTTGLLANVRY